MKRKSGWLILTFFGFSVFLFLSLTNIVLACTTKADCGPGQICSFADPFSEVGECVAEGTGVSAPEGTGVSGGSAGSAQSLKDPLEGITGGKKGIEAVQVITKNIITAALGFTGVLALIAFIYGGLLWMVSGGDSGRVTKGKNTMIWAIAGLVIIFLSYVILKMIFEILGIK
ncbi:MAG: pilin [Patescibacteria group bacterium]